MEPYDQVARKQDFQRQSLARILRMRNGPAHMVGDQVSDKGRSTAGDNDGSAEQMKLALAGFIAQRPRAEVRRNRRRTQRSIETALQPARSAVRRVV